VTATPYKGMGVVKPLPTKPPPIPPAAARKPLRLERLVARNEPRIHVSGLTMTYDSTAAPGARLGTVTLAGGAPLDTTAQYRVILNDFMALGGEGLGFTSGAIRTEPLSVVDLDALITYLRKQPQPVRAPTELRIVPRNAEQ
jgi:2',3'-cyclic-nucleotide 2'-phosphodiesterase (5'-nucleotidase family)